MAKVSSGLLLFRRRREGLEVLLVHPGGPFWAKKDEGAWTIPKGELAEGEELKATALREFVEELGWTAPRESDLTGLGHVTQKAGKVVHVWAFEGDGDPTAISGNTFSMEWPPKSGKQREFPEVDRAAFFSLEQARLKLNPAQVEFLDRLERFVSQNQSAR